MSAEKTASGNHPDKTRLAAYLESVKSDEFRDVRGHLVTCSVCRKDITAMQNALHGLKRFPQSLEVQPEGEHLSEMVIADYVERRLPADELAATKQHVMGCGFCTKAALHYATHSVETQRMGVSAEGTEFLDRIPQVIQEMPRRLGRKEGGFFSWRMPVWIGVPATALATLLLILLLSHPTQKESLEVVSYQDKPEVVFTPPKGEVPGIGFFGEARQRTEPYGGLTIHPQDDQHLDIKWSEIKTAKVYEIKIYSSGEEGRTLIGQTSTSDKTEVVLQISGMMPGKRYEWELSGKTLDERRFLARGGFVVGLQVKF